MCPPITIHNDVGVNVFLDQKKVNLDFFLKYPLCISLVDHQMHNEGHSVINTNIINCDVRLTNIYVDLYSNNSIHLIQMNLEGVIKENNEGGDDIISDHSNLFVAEDQVYNDKETLKEVMRHVGLVEKFSFRFVRCNASK